MIVIDSSGSMLAKEGEKTRFALAKEEVQKVIDHLRSDQALTLIEAGREPKVLLSKSADKQALQQALQQIPARMGSSDNPGALSLAKAIATSEPGSGIMWFGDGGSDAFSETDMDGLEASSFRFVQTGKTKENVAIGTFVTQKGRQGTEGLLRIDNHGIQRKRGKVAVYDQNKRLLDVAAFEI
ncbi:VWA domain-containing protein, partial [Microbacteriaceae bacterium K1510]|nr:VWA domain-containing protein [Microbacteriaceae bacterium K1510]